MVEVLGWGCLFLIIGFGAGRLRLHCFNDNPGALSRLKRPLTAKQTFNLFFGLYIGLVVALVQKVVEHYGSDLGSPIQIGALALLIIILAIVIQIFLLGPPSRKPDPPNAAISRADSRPAQ